MRKTYLIPALLLLSLAFALPAYTIDVKEEKLGNLPAGVLSDAAYMEDQEIKLIQETSKIGYTVDIDALKKSPFDRHLAAIIPKDNGKCCVWLDGKEQATYDQIRGIVKGAYRAQDFKFSPDGNRLAYVAEKGNKWVMVVDGRESAEFDGVREPYFSADSKHICYVGFRGKECIPVVDGKEQGRYKGVQMNFPSYTALTPQRLVDCAYCPIIFGPNGHFAYVANKGHNKNNIERNVAVIDGKESSEYERIQGIGFSPDGKHTAFTAFKNEKMFVVMDGKAGAKYDDIDGILTFSPDSNRLAYAATNYGSNENRQSFVVVDGNKGPGFRDISSISIMFSPDSKHITYKANTGDEKYCVVTDNKPGKMYDEIGSGDACQMYGKDGKLYYIAKQGDKYYMVADGMQSTAYDYIYGSCPVFSPNEKHNVYVAKSGDRDFVVRDGKAEPGYSRIYQDSLIIDDNLLAYSAATSDTFKQVTVINGKEHAGINKVVFNHDQTRMAYLADNDNYFNKISVMLADKKIGDYADVIGLRFDAENTLTFLAVREDSVDNGLVKCLYRVKAM